MEVTIQSRRTEYSGWYGKEVSRVVYYVDGKFLHHQYEGAIPKSDKERYAKAMQAKIENYKQTGGEWINSMPLAVENHNSWRVKEGPIPFIKEVRKCKQTFDPKFTSLAFCENGACWMFCGELNEVSNVFYFVIYSKELADKVRELIPEVRFVPDDAIIL